MSKRGQIPHNRTGSHRSELLSSSLEYLDAPLRGTPQGLGERASRGGGAYRDRTDDPLLAKQVLSQLS